MGDEHGDSQGASSVGLSHVKNKTSQNTRSIAHSVSCNAQSQLTHLHSHRIEASRRHHTTSCGGEGQGVQRQLRQMADHLVVALTYLAKETGSLARGSP